MTKVADNIEIGDRHPTAAFTSSASSAKAKHGPAATVSGPNGSSSLPAPNPMRETSIFF
jgi:hypothetical protein